MTNTSGVILAGGKNIRMGYPKSFLTVKGKRIIDIILDVFRLLFEEILVVTDNKSRFAGFKDIAVTAATARVPPG